LPNAGGDDELDLLACRQVRSKSKERGAPVGVELEHLDGVAEIEVEDLVGRENVHLGEGFRLEQVVDGRALRAGAAGQIDCGRGCVGAAVEAALDRVRLKAEQLLDLIDGHDHRW